MEEKRKRNQRKVSDKQDKWNYTIVTITQLKVI